MDYNIISQNTQRQDTMSNNIRLLELGKNYRILFHLRRIDFNYPEIIRKSFIRMNRISYNNMTLFISYNRLSNPMPGHRIIRQQHHCRAQLSKFSHASLSLFVTLSRLRHRVIIIYEKTRARQSTVAFVGPSTHRFVSSRSFRLRREVTDGKIFNIDEVFINFINLL